jgi:lipoyl(octanoyl) transferase
MNDNIGFGSIGGASSGEPAMPPASQELRPPSLRDAQTHNTSGLVWEKRQDAASTLDLRVRWLGRMDFADALGLQEEVVAKKREDRESADELLLLEHEPVYTIGRTPDQSSLLGAVHLPHPLFPINRGGQATYHGPGQLMGYPIVDLRRYGQDLHRYLRWLERLLIEFLGEYGIAATRREGLTGVWIENPEGIGAGRKIASIGVGVRHWITMHGFALNVCGDLSPFNFIVPCGINNVAMTSMEKESGGSFSVVDVAGAFEKLVRQRVSNLRIDQPLSAVGVSCL